MRSTIYHIKSEALKPFVQYILFNQVSGQAGRTCVISYPNTNYCLGIQLGTEMYASKAGMKIRPKRGMNTYISGLYTQPHVFYTQGTLDEICIDFTMAGFYRFFTLPPACYHFDNSILTRSFGTQAIPFFSHIFSQEDLSIRGQGIEQFLLFCLRQTKRGAQDYHYLLEQAVDDFSAGALAHQLRLSERSMQRLFRKHFTTTPKRYLRIRRFRAVLNTITSLQATGNPLSWEQLAYSCGYFDYSHFYRDLLLLTGRSPSDFLRSMTSISNTVTVGVEPVN